MHRQALVVMFTSKTPDSHVMLLGHASFCVLWHLLSALAWTFPWRLVNSGPECWRGSVAEAAGFLVCAATQTVHWHCPASFTALLCVCACARAWTDMWCACGRICGVCDSLKRALSRGDEATALLPHSLSPSNRNAQIGENICRCWRCQSCDVQYTYTHMRAHTHRLSQGEHEQL